MDLCTLDLTYNELVFIRQSLDFPTISGKDAKFLAALQIKFEEGITQFDQTAKKEQEKKTKELQAIIESDGSKSVSKK